MSKQMLVSKRQEILRVADDEFVRAIRQLPERMAARLAFMSRDHHAVRDCVVRELPLRGSPLSPRQIATATGIDPDRVSTILSDLEQHLFFLVRDAGGSVSWAFPVTTDATAHRLSFSTGEKIFGA